MPLYYVDLSWDPERDSKEPHKNVFRTLRLDLPAEYTLAQVEEAVAGGVEDTEKKYRELGAFLGWFFAFSAGYSLQELEFFRLRGEEI